MTDHAEEAKGGEEQEIDRFYDVIQHPKDIAQKTGTAAAQNRRIATAGRVGKLNLGMQECTTKR